MSLPKFRHLKAKGQLESLDGRWILIQSYRGKWALYDRQLRNGALRDLGTWTQVRNTLASLIAS